MSKQVNRVNIEPEILRGKWSSYWKYNELFVNNLTSCNTDIISVNEKIIDIMSSAITKSSKKRTRDK